MKKIGILGILLCTATFSQAELRDTTKINIGDKQMQIINGDQGTQVIFDGKELVKVSENGKRTKVIVGEKEIVNISNSNVNTPETTPNDTVTEKERKDTTQIKLGERAISIMEDADGNTVVKVIDMNKDEKINEDTAKTGESENEDEDYSMNESKDENGKHFSFKGKDGKFKGHWAGLELGLNNYVDKNFSTSRKPENDFMDLNTGKSWNFNLNFMQHSFSLASNKLGLVTGLGFEWCNYRFDGSNSIKKVDGNVIADTSYNRIGVSVEKSKLTTFYLTLPLLLEAKFPGTKLHVSVGVIGGLKLGSHTKVVYKDNGDEQTDKVHEDFNINSLRYGFTARVGYKGLSVFANYYATPLFENGKGPELYPYTVGLALGF
jgi:hypothetical protein